MNKSNISFYHDNNAIADLNPDHDDYEDHVCVFSSHARDYTHTINITLGYQNCTYLWPRNVKHAFNYRITHYQYQRLFNINA